MITETTRLCTACSVLLPEPPAPQVCTRCSRVALPLHTEWPPKLKRWLLGQFVKSFFAPWADATEQYRWERLLFAVMHAKQWSSRIIPHAAAPIECYSTACEELTKWDANGCPPLY